MDISNEIKCKFIYHLCSLQNSIYSVGDVVHLLDYGYIPVACGLLGQCWHNHCDQANHGRVNGLHRSCRAVHQKLRAYQLRVSQRSAKEGHAINGLQYDWLFWQFDAKEDSGFVDEREWLLRARRGFYIKFTTSVAKCLPNALKFNINGFEPRRKALNSAMSCRLILTRFLRVKFRENWLLLRWVSSSRRPRNSVRHPTPLQ